MEHVIDAFMAVVVLVLMMQFGTGVVSAQTAVAEARACKDEIVAQLEDSGFHPDVVNSCITAAENNGYGISVTVYRDGEEKKNYTAATASAADLKTASAAEVSLSYRYKLSLLGSSSLHHVRGFAR